MGIAPFRKEGYEGLPTLCPQRAGADREVLGSFFF